MKSKRHHFIPKAYLKAFLDGDGKICVYRKDDPGRVFRQSPDSVGFHRHYYAQPLPEGGYDHDKLENFFSEYESRWPSIVERLHQRDNVNDCIEDIFAFMALQRARVPATRDAVEAFLAATVKDVAQRLDAARELPPKPKGFEDILEHIKVAIDPHKSIHAMVDVIRGTGRVMERLGIGALHNGTSIPLVTSDNPVIWFDPCVPESEMRPYMISPDGPIVLLLPVAPDLMIYGHSSLLDQFNRQGIGYGDLTDSAEVERMNRQICRFAYQVVFAQVPGFENLVKEHAGVSPVVRGQTIPTDAGDFIFTQYVFGERGPKPKWKPRGVV